MKTLTVLFSLIISGSIFGSSFILPQKTVMTYNRIEDILKTIDPSILPHGPAQDEFTEELMLIVITSKF
jgi:hypothetical protein